MGAAEAHEAVQDPSDGQDKIFVSVRFRPLNEKEIAKNDASDWECINDTTIVHRNNFSVSERSMYPAAYTFDRVFRPDCSTRQVYEEGAKEVALSVVSGINSSVFAYGQTSSGKTYTMSGITEYTVADIYDYIARHKERQFLLKLSAMEIYNESVRDLLSPDTTPLRLLDDPERGTVVERLAEENLRDWNHFKGLLAICEAQRQIGETSLNETSSRSHQILRLTIESSAREFLDNDKSSTLMATVNFIDLAGSERASQSLSAGMRLKEGCHINRSLLTLGTVIRKLSKGRTGHVPFRDSKLTRILQSSLGGNARTAIICTLSPARCHVEQSRNTLLFASCAKEVATNAQVNIVMSDKALVKQLQRELARLENELKCTGTSSVTSDSSILLREKDLQIEKLMREVADLTRNLNHVQSQFDDLLEAVEDVRPSAIWVDANHQYRKVRVQSSWRSENSVSYSLLAEDPHSLNANVRPFSASRCSEQSSSSSISDENFIQLEDFEHNFPPVVSTSELSIRNAKPVGNNVHEKRAKEQTIEDIDDICKEVQCIQVEESSTMRYANSKMSDSIPNTDENSKEAQCIEVEEPSTKRSSKSRVSESSPNRDEKSKEVQCIKVEEPSTMRYANLNMSESSLNRYAGCRMSSPSVITGTLGVTEVENVSTTNQELVSPTLKEDEQFSNLRSDFFIPSPEKHSPCLLKEDISGLKLSRSRSCRGRLANSLTTSCFEKEEINGNTPPSGFEKEYTGRPEGTKLSALKNHFDIKILSRNASETSASSVDVDELKVQSVKTLTDWKSSSVSNSDAGIIYTTDDLVQETEPEHIASEKNVKDVGLDPMEDDVENALKWPSEFSRLQREIVDLWHALNVSLVHRTYFFLLFKGDPTDSFYMEVEHRRLSFLKDMFSLGKTTMVDRRILTPTSSKRALNQERQMLCKQMQRRLSSAERENLFLRWGIPLNANRRRMQLVHSLWIKTTDMDHISESAALVAKLIGFEEQEQSLKDMFGLLTFTPIYPSKSRSSIWKRNVLSFL